MVSHIYVPLHLALSLDSAAMPKSYACEASVTTVQVWFVLHAALLQTADECKSPIRCPNCKFTVEGAEWSSILYLVIS